MTVRANGSYGAAATVATPKPARRDASNLDPDATDKAGILSAPIIRSFRRDRVHLVDFVFRARKQSGYRRSDDDAHHRGNQGLFTEHSPTTFPDQVVCSRAIAFRRRLVACNGSWRINAEPGNGHLAVGRCGLPKDLARRK